MADEENSIKLDSEFVRADVVAKLFGVTVRRIQQLTQDGVLPTVKVNGQGHNKYELVPTIQRYIQYLSDKAHGKAKSENEGLLKEQKLKAEIALKESQGELHRLRTDIAAGKYISIEEVRLDYSRFFVVLKKFVLGVPSKMAGRIAGYVDPVEVRQIENDLQKEANKILKSFVVAATVEKNEGLDA